MSWSGVKQQASIDVEAIEKWCDDMGIKNYTINTKGEIDVDGNIDIGFLFIANKMVKELPYKFGRVNGSFDLSGNTNLTSLKNCPKYVGGYFACSFCTQLNSLEGCPIEVGGYFSCGNCKRKFEIEELIQLCNVRSNKLYL